MHSFAIWTSFTLICHNKTAIVCVLFNLMNIILFGICVYNVFLHFKNALSLGA